VYLNLHDFSGHPFQVQLARELARRGHRVDHTYCAQYETGRGRLDRQDSDPESLSIVPLEAELPLDKYQLIRRLRFELSYAHAWRRFLDARPFDLVVSCNVPLVSLARIQTYLRKRALPWVFWHQDIYSHAMTSELARRLPLISGPAARRIERYEISQVRDAHHVVAISERFITQYQRWALPVDHTTVIPNWAPLDDICPVQRDNEWSQRMQLPASGLRLLYSGTLGRKHNPLLLLELIDRIQTPCTLVVCSQGAGADLLRDAARGRADVIVLGFQPAELFGQVLSSADVMLTLLEPDASEFSVPSKVHSYLSAGRPIVGLMPEANPAAKDILNAGGFVAAPTSSGTHGAASWITQQSRLPGRFEDLGRLARDYAMQRFDIQVIADQFEAVFDKARSRAQLGMCA
jgi:colanic acid biosynthesis glycosyl transferase WcaI